VCGIGPQDYSAGNVADSSGIRELWATFFIIYHTPNSLDNASGLTSLRVECVPWCIPVTESRRVQFAESRCVWPYAQTIIIIIITANIIRGKNFRHDLTSGPFVLSLTSKASRKKKGL
jgi:hypothetical protein